MCSTEQVTEGTDIRKPVLERVIFELFSPLKTHNPVKLDIHTHANNIVRAHTLYYANVRDTCTLHYTYGSAVLSTFIVINRIFHFCV